MDETEDVKRGTIKKVQVFGGIIQLVVQAADGALETLTGDNGPTVRALIGIFGPEIVRGHSVILEQLIGQEVGYGLDDVGVLAFLEA